LLRQEALAFIAVPDLAHPCRDRHTARRTHTSRELTQTVLSSEVFARTKSVERARAAAVSFVTSTRGELRFCLMTAPRAEIDARIGAVLSGRYRLLRVLGAGGMGAVYEAEDDVTKTRVAVKVMLREAMAQAEAVSRFFREAHAAARIEHPNIITVLHVGHDPGEGALFLVEELLAGADLRHALDREGRLTPRAALEALVPVLHALAAAHARGVIHRDLKPENIFLATDAEGRTAPKLIDFGVAKVVETGAASLGLTKTGALLGTPFYMSPEQARGDRAVGTWTDIWAIGVVLFETLAGSRPFRSENYNALIHAVLHAPVPRLDVVAPGVPPSLARVVARALERDLAHRYKSVDDLLRALLDCADLRGEDWFQALVTRYRPPGETPSDALAIGLAATLPEGTRGVAVPEVTLATGNRTPLSWSEPGRDPRRRRKAALVVLLVCASLAAALVVAFRSPPTTDP
jgi:serine/threonine-protein kinase